MQDISEMIAKSSLFSNLTPDGIYRLAELAQIKTFKKGELIIEEGKPGTGCYIITSGKVEVIKGINNNTPKIIAVLSAGEIIGEMSVIDGLPYSATVRTLEDTECVMIEQWDFKAQLQAYPEIALQLLPVLAKRLRAMNEQQFEGNA